MKVMQPKIWSTLRADLERHPTVVHMEHFLASRRLWAVLGMAGVVALVMAVVVLIVMFAFWVAGVYLSKFDISPVL